MNGNIDTLLINKNLSVKNAMKQMDRASKKILFVVDRKRALIGTVTDGDIRRWILADGDLNSDVDKIYNRDPIFVKKGISKKEARKKMLMAAVESIPVLNQNKQVIGMFFWRDLISDSEDTDRGMKLNLPVVIMAGGQGSRLDPFTRILPKALIPIGDKPIIELIIDKFLKYVLGDIYLILGFKGEMIKSYFDHLAVKYRLKYLHEGKIPLGTVGGLRFIPKDFPETFFLTNCDTIVKAHYDDIYGFHKKNNNDITIIGSMQYFMIPYGVLEITSGGNLKKIEEKPEFDFLVNTGMYLINKKVLKYIACGKAFHITNLIKKIKEHNGKIGVYPISEKSWFDVGQWETYKETQKNLFGSL